MHFITMHKYTKNNLTPLSRMQHFIFQEPCLQRLQLEATNKLFLNERVPSRNVTNKLRAQSERVEQRGSFPPREANLACVFMLIWPRIYEIDTVRNTW